MSCREDPVPGQHGYVVDGAVPVPGTSLSTGAVPGTGVGSGPGSILGTRIEIPPPPRPTAADRAVEFAGDRIGRAANEVRRTWKRPDGFLRGWLIDPLAFELARTAREHPWAPEGDWKVPVGQFYYRAIAIPFLQATHIFRQLHRRAISGWPTVAAEITILIVVIWRHVA